MLISSISQKLKGNKDLAFPLVLSTHLAGITERLNAAQLREAFQASLMRIAAHTIVGDEFSDDGVEIAEDSKQNIDSETHPAEFVASLPLAIEMQKQVDILRESVSKSSKIGLGSSARGRFLREEDECSWRQDSVDEVIPRPDLKTKRVGVLNCFKWWKGAKTS
jgi:hypothetical protein